MSPIFSLSFEAIALCLRTSLLRGDLTVGVMATDALDYAAVCRGYEAEGELRTVG